MDTTLLINKFNRMGARLKIAHQKQRGALKLDIQEDRKGEFFEILPAGDRNATAEVIDLRASMRHLLLLVRQKGEKSKYLCGHDERHWFVAGIPETAPVGTVHQAMESLQPLEVQSALGKKRVPGKKINRRKNSAFVRQGEWFFLPVPKMEVDARFVLQNEPLSRGAGSKPHLVDECYRTGGETVYVCHRHPTGLLYDEYREVLARSKRAKNWGWTVMRRNPGVYVRGRVRHPDHATILLQTWHQVVMNTESESRAMKHVVFLD